VKGESWLILPAQNKSFQQHLQAVSSVITTGLGDMGISGCGFTVLMTH
jgi:hypothetical protein